VRNVAAAASRDGGQSAAGPGHPGEELPPDAPDVTLVVPLRALVKWAATLKASSNLGYRLAEGKNGRRPDCAPTLERLAREQSALAEGFLRKAEKACGEAGEALPLDLVPEPAERESALGKL
jgi:hypothetical protein